jgi:asparagine N-glycosylation enzyme membrane subunit Stt3
MFAVAVFARRIFFFAAPPICVMAGMGLSNLLELRGLRLSRTALGYALSLMDAKSLRRYAAAGLGVMIIVVCLFQSVAVAYVIGSNGFIAASNDWQAGMAWLRHNSPQDAVVMSHWNNGYFILDLSGRKPVVDNGNWDEERNYDISVVYCTTDISEAVRMMERHDANYAVFSKNEYVLLPRLTGDALGQPYGDGTSIPSEMRGSLYARALSGEFVSEGGLRRVYPENLDATDLPLVILELDTG